MKIIVNDKMQKNYTYETSEPIGQNFAPDFLPELHLPKCCTWESLRENI